MSEIKAVAVDAGMTRADRKAQTRARILAACWHLIEEGRGLDSLGLREVARAAGLAAPSLYNHFGDMESLGVALLDQACFRFRRWMTEGRRELIKASPDEAIALVVARFLQYLEQHDAEFRLLVQQRTGSHATYRRRIHHELHLAVVELGDDIAEVVGRPRSEGDVDVEAEAMAAILLGFGIQALDIDKLAYEQLQKRLVVQLTMVMQGARFLRAVQDASSPGK